MCGIVGFHTIKQFDFLASVSRMRDTLVHRGPDASGAFVVAKNGLALGHRRLAILDLTNAGTQPFSVDNEKFVITFNGEIYNFQTLRDELLSHGYRFKTSTDTEVLLRAYQHWGSDVLTKIEGMFAFAIYDQSKQELFCARDRAGEKPFFYFLSDDTFAFASECKALFTLPESPRQIDYKSLQQYLAFGYSSGDRTMVGGIKKLQPGHTLTYSLRERKLKITQYWTPSRSLLSPLTDVEQCADNLHELLKRSIRKQLIADVPIGILLSGGVDSSIVAAVASTMTPRSLKTFTAIFPGAGVYNEAKYAKQVAKHIGSVHTELVVEQQSVDILRRLAVQFDEPIADSSMVPTYLVSSLIREHATVALGGDGADELFGGYPHHRWFCQLEMFRQWIPKALRPSLREFAARCIPVGTRGRNFLLGLLNTKEEALNKFNVYFSEAATKQILSDSSLQAMNHLDSNFEIDRLSTQLTKAIGSDNTPLIDFLSYLPNDILTKVDRASMLTSLEVRSPWLDKQIIEYAFEKIPIRLKCSTKELKCVPKVLAARLLPDSLNLNRKQGFSIPLHKWFSGKWGAFFNEVLMESESNLFNRDGLAELMRNPSNAGRNMQRLFSLTMLELWRREYGIST
jgi:asparagine synthase (glutamine-hydrolysing)